MPFKRQSSNCSGGCGTGGACCILSTRSVLKDRIEALLKDPLDPARLCFELPGEG